MAKFFGSVGYGIATETTPGVWIEVPTERNYSGDIVRNRSQWQQAGDKVNDDLTFSNQISIISDSFAEQNCQSIRYIKWMGAFWKVTGVEVQRPRLILTIGGVYNGKTVGPA